MKNAKFIFVFFMLLFAVSACGTNNGTPDQEKISIPPSTQKLESEQKTIPRLNLLPSTDKNQAKPKKVLLGGYHTTLLDRDSDRVKNINLAAKKINGYVVQPGKTFSFNTVVGKRKPEKGYRKARILVNGEKEEGIGGGICQLSSTLYNAVDKAGLKVIERHSHSNDVHYVPRGRDAAISYGTRDFRFENTKSYPVEISSVVRNGRIYMSIWTTNQL